MTTTHNELIERLRTEYAKIERVDPEGPAYQGICRLLDGLATEHLKQLVDADIKFVSGLARNRVSARELADMPTLDDSFGCDPWDEDNHGRHAASKERS